MKLLPPLCLLAVLLTGCLSPARRLDPQVTDQIQPGRSRAEVEKLLGRPEHMETGGNGRTLAVYSFGDGQLTYGSQGLALRVLSLLYSPRFVVERRLMHDSRVAYESHFFKLDEFGQLLAREEIIGKMKPVMNREEVVAEFGPPFFERLNVDGGSTLIWWAGRQRFSLFGQAYDTQSFVVTCNELGLVTDYRVFGQVEPKEKPAEN